jgi:hypothetical protein
MRSAHRCGFLVCGVMIIASACGDASETAQPGATSESTSDPVVETETSSTESTSDTSSCEDIPALTLVGIGAERVEMDLVFFEGFCGYNADGAAMFDNAYRPRRAVLAHDQVYLAKAQGGAVTVDVRPLEQDLVLSGIAPSLPAGSADEDGTYAIAVDASGCAVVTIDWRSDSGRGRFTGLVEDEPNACSAA